jgi:hypothetical protein
MNYVTLLFSVMFILNIAFAQNTISGQVIAGNPQGFTVIGCLINLATSDCNYEKSQLTEINPDGSYSLTNLEAGQYLVIAWKDTNNSGNLEEDQDEVGYYVTADGQPGLVSPPVTNINITLPSSASQPTTTNPLTEPAPPTQGGNTLLGTWYKGYASSTSYQDSVTGISAPPTGGGWNYTFNADGSYIHSFLYQNTFYSCTTTIFNYEEGTYVAQDSVLMLTPTSSHTKSEDDCVESSNYEKDIPLDTEYFFFQFGRDIFMDIDNGETLELTDLILNSQGILEVDPEDSTPLALRREQ